MLAGGVRVDVLLLAEWYILHTHTHTHTSVFSVRSKGVEKTSDFVHHTYVYIKFIAQKAFRCWSMESVF